MNAETGSGTPSWEEWVEQLTQLPEEEQLTELLDKARTLRDENKSLRDMLDAEKKKTVELANGLKQVEQAKKESEARLEKEISMKEKNLEKKISMQLADRYDVQIHKVKRMFLAALGGCLIFIVALAAGSPEYMQDAATLGNDILIKCHRGISLYKGLLHDLMSAAGRKIDNRIIIFCIEGLVILLSCAIACAVIGGIIFLIVQAVRKCWRKNAALMMVEGVSAFAIPVMLGVQFRALGLNTCCISGVIITVCLAGLLLLCK